MEESTSSTVKPHFEKTNLVEKRVCGSQRTGIAAEGLMDEDSCRYKTKKYQKFDIE
jgi:hypothetical protein